MDRQNDIVLRVELADAFATEIAFGADDARWRIGDLEAMRATTDNLLTACTRVVGKPLREWETTFELLGIPVSGLTGRSNLHANAIKAVGLLAVWMEPSVRARVPTLQETSLCDQVIVDYTGAPGQQPYIYLLPVQQQIDTDAHMRLFELGLLSRLWISGRTELRRWFKPLVTPIVPVDQFGSSQRLWAKIKNDMQAAVRRAAGGRP